MARQRLPERTSYSVNAPLVADGSAAPMAEVLTGFAGMMMALGLILLVSALAVSTEIGRALTITGSMFAWAFPLTVLFVAGRRETLVQRAGDRVPQTPAPVPRSDLLVRFVLPRAVPMLALVALISAGYLAAGAGLAIGNGLALLVGVWVVRRLEGQRRVTYLQLAGWSGIRRRPLYASR